MQHKSESKGHLIDNECCENIKNISTPTTKPRRNSINLQPDDLDLYYVEGFESGKQSNNIVSRHKILVSLVLVLLAISSVVAITVIKQGGLNKSGYSYQPNTPILSNGPVIPLRPNKDPLSVENRGKMKSSFEPSRKVPLIPTNMSYIETNFLNCDRGQREFTSRRRCKRKGCCHGYKCRIKEIDGVAAYKCVKDKGGLLLPQSGSWKGYYFYNDVRHEFAMDINFWKNGSLSGSMYVGSQDVLDVTGLWNNQGIRFSEYNKSAHDVKYTGRGYFNDLTILDGRWSYNQLEVSFHVSYVKS